MQQVAALEESDFHQDSVRNELQGQVCCASGDFSAEGVLFSLLQVDSAGRGAALPVPPYQVAHALQPCQQVLIARLNFMPPSPHTAPS